MSKGILLGVLITAVVISVWAGGMKSIRAQTIPNSGPADAGSILERLVRIEEKVNLLAKQIQGNSSAAVLSRLDQVLANQQKILSELDIVKVRASQKR